MYDKNAPVKRLDACTLSPMLNGRSRLTIESGEGLEFGDMNAVVHIGGFENIIVDIKDEKTAELAWHPESYDGLTNVPAQLFEWVEGPLEDEGKFDKKAFERDQLQGHLATMEGEKKITHSVDKTIKIFRDGTFDVSRRNGKPEVRPAFEGLALPPAPDQ